MIEKLNDKNVQSDWKITEKNIWTGIIIFSLIFIKENKRIQKHESHFSFAILSTPWPNN